MPTPTTCSASTTYASTTSAKGGAISCYGAARTLARVRRMFDYVFDPATPKGGGTAAARPAGACRSVLAGGRHHHPGAAPARHAAGARVPHRRLRLPYRLQRHSRRFVAVARRPRRPRTRRPAPQGPPDALHRGAGRGGGAADRRPPHVVHAHDARPAARGHLRRPCRRASRLPTTVWSWMSLRPQGIVCWSLVARRPTSIEHPPQVPTRHCSWASGRSEWRGGPAPSSSAGSPSAAYSREAVDPPVDYYGGIAHGSHSLP